MLKSYYYALITGQLVSLVWLGRDGLWGGVLDVLSTVVLRFNLTRDLSRYVRIPLRSLQEQFRFVTIVFEFVFGIGIGYYFLLPIELLLDCLLHRLTTCPLSGSQHARSCPMLSSMVVRACSVLQALRVGCCRPCSCPKNPGSAAEELQPVKCCCALVANASKNNRQYNRQ